MYELAHAKLGASSMHRWSKCPGSIRQSEGMPNTSSKYAEEGTLAHEIASAMLLNSTYKPPKDLPEDMLPAIQVYIQAIEDVRYSGSGNSTLLVEHRFHLKALRDDLFGTADAVVWSPATRVLHVLDYKHGAGHVVEVENNVQLLYYALGAVLTLNYKPKTIRIHVVQPRCPHPMGPVRSWELPVVDLLEFEGALLHYAEQTEKPDAPLVSGDHCDFCPALPTCPAVKSVALATVDTVFPDLDAYSPDELAANLEKVDLIEQWCKALRGFAYSEAERGKHIPGYKLVEKRGSRKWSDDEEKTIRTIVKRAKLNPDLFFTEPKLLSPAQVEKVLKEHDLKPKLIEDLTVLVSSGSKLVKDSAAGDPIKLLGAAEIFDDLDD